MGMAKATTNTDPETRQIIAQLRVTNRLLMAQLDLLALQARMPLTQQTKVSLLAKAGLGAQDIAELLDTTPNVVRKALFRLRKKTNSSSEGETSADDDESTEHSAHPDEEGR